MSHIITVVELQARARIARLQAFDFGKAPPPKERVPSREISSCGPFESRVIKYERNFYKGS
jgi:hypothetical protein